MKLYLASKHVPFPTELASLVGKKSENTIAKLVVNAFDNYPNDRRESHIANVTQSLKNAGYSPEFLDLREYVDKMDSLLLLLSKADLLWISGGNVFYLRYLLHKCGLDSELGRLIEKGLVYGGDSAGAAVIGHDLHGLDLLDDTKEAPEIIYEGLGITDFIILPHWGNERYKEEIENAKSVLEKYNDEIVTISDDQVYVVDDNSRNIIG